MWWGVTVFGVCLGLVHVQAAGPVGGFVIVETIGGGQPRIMAGDAALADVPQGPASTFKIVVALTGFEAGVASPDLRHACRDVPGARQAREIDMREAMRASSNEYFSWLAGRIGAEKIGATAVRIGFAQGPLREGWAGPDPGAIVRGGDLKVSARRLHDVTVRVMRGTAASSVEVQHMLEEVLSWPSPDPGSRVLGKTGAWGGAAWFTGFVDRQGERRAATVLVTYAVPNWRPARARAIDLFFSRANLPRPTDNH